MRIQFSAANIAVNITDNDGNLALDYTVKEIVVEGNMATLAKAFEEMGKDIEAQVQASGFDITKALDAIGNGSKPN